jgi:hypothetical protein
VSDDAAVLWERLGFLFVEDDGSLPEVRLVGLSADGLSQAWDFLLSRAEPLPADASLWHHQRGESVQLRDLRRPAELVSSGQALPRATERRPGRPRPTARPRSVHRAQRTHPQPNELTLDYRMGSQWQPHTLAAFVELLGELQALDPEAQLDLEEHADPRTRTLFTNSARDYLSRRTSS